MFFRLLSTALLPFLFVACGKTNKSNNRMKTFDIDSPNAVEASSNWQVQCLDSKNCPNTVGQLLMVSGGKGGACTATLIGPDLALSNSHCFDFLPGRSADSTCTGGRTVMIFASNSPSGREVVECESVIRKSELRKSEGLRSPDYLIIKLKRKLNRGFESINTSGVSDGQALVIKKVNPTRLNLGELEVSRCEVVHGTLFMPGNKSRESAVHVTKGCEVIEGNSGSSLFDAQGKIRGVIYAKLNPDEMDKSGIEGIEDVTSVIRRVKAGYMTNAACMKLSANRTLPKDCKIPNSKEDEIQVESLDGFAEFKRNAMGLVRDSRFQYELIEGESKNLKTKVSYRPICFNANLPLTNINLISVPIVNWNVFLTTNDSLRAKIRSAGPQPESCLFQLRLQPSATAFWVEPKTLGCSLALTQKANWNNHESWKSCSSLNLAN